jgi:hypothetical protein
VLSLSAVETEQKLTVLTPAYIFRLLDIGDTFASRQRAPTNVIHLFNRSVQAVLLVFLDDALTEPQCLDVEVVQVFATALLSALNLTYLTRLHLCKNHTSDALSAKVVLAAGEEEKFVAKLVARTNPTVVLFTVKFALVCLLAKLKGLFEILLCRKV